MLRRTRATNLYQDGTELELISRILGYWFSLKNRTDLNHLAKRGWIKKETVYTAGRAQYLYSIHSVIASAIRAQRQSVLYDSCQPFIREVTIDMQNAAANNDAEKKALIQFSWSLNDIFRGDFHSDSDCDFLWALAEIYRDIGYYERALPLLEMLKTIYTELYGKDCVQLSSVWNSCGLIHFELSHFNDALTAYSNSRAILLNHIAPEDLSPLARTELGKLDMNIGNVYRKVDFQNQKYSLNLPTRIFSMFWDQMHTRLCWLSAIKPSTLHNPAGCPMQKRLIWISMIGAKTM